MLKIVLSCVSSSYYSMLLFFFINQEIVGGMLDAEPSLWRKPHKQNFEDQRQKVLQFEKWWAPYDWTRELNNDDDD